MATDAAWQTKLVDALRRDAKRFGPKLASLALSRGLAVTKLDGTRVPIPVTATPVIIEADELARRQRLAAHLASAGLKMARHVLTGPLRPVVYDGLSPLEQALADATVAKLDRLVTTRVDFFVGDKPWALELNATIPAMQAYSDIAVGAFLEAVGDWWGVPAHARNRWQANNGSNALALFRALLRGYGEVRRGRQPERIAILTRRNDAQLSELQYLRERFEEWGPPTDIVYPDQLSGDDAVRANGQAYDFVYRHLFVRRLEEPTMQGADYVKALLAEPNGKRAVVLNPPASQVEVKAVFAYLSAALEDAALAKGAGLAQDELAAIHESVPWTRVFRGPELLAQVAQAPKDYVLKRSWDYGGRAVFVGKSVGTPGFDERVKAAYGTTLDWPALCARAEADRHGGGFVVQRLVETTTEPHLICSGDIQTEADLYVDFSCYASVGLEEQPKWGGVCRGSISHIVNIVGGGGVLPLLTVETAKLLWTAYQAELPPRG